MTSIFHQEAALLIKKATTSFLPKGYKAVEYLQSTGTQWINSGIIPTINTKAQIIFSSIVNSNYNWYGSRFNNQIFAIISFLNGTYLAPQFINSTWTSLRIPFEQNKKYDIIIENGSSIVNDTEYTFDKITDFNTKAPIWIFRCDFNQSSSSSVIRPQKIYAHRIWENDELIQELIPCLNSENEPCFYDTVTKTDFKNDGTGIFEYGKIINI